MKVATIDVVWSCMGFGMAAERSWMLKGGSCHGQSWSGGPAERKLSGLLWEYVSESEVWDVVDVEADEKVAPSTVASLRVHLREV